MLISDGSSDVCASDLSSYGARSVLVGMWRKNSVPLWQSSGRLRYRIPDQCDESTCTFARPTSPARVIRNFACDSVGGIGLSGSPTSRDTASVNPPISIRSTELRPGKIGRAHV